MADPKKESAEELQAKLQQMRNDEIVAAGKEIAAVLKKYNVAIIPKITITGDGMIFPAYDVVPVMNGHAR